MAKVLIIVGTRPEIIKQAPVIEEAKRQGLDFVFVTTGQHYDYGLCTRFIDELGLPPPDHSIHLVKRDPVEQMGEMMVGLKKIVEGERDPLLLVEGDTNTVAASAIVGRKLSLTVGHVEAGLRSFDWRMPEEHNRIMVDHLADILFAPTEPSRQNLLRERVHGNIHVTGNTIIDAAIRNTPLAVKQSKIRNRIRFEKYVLA
ncbi:UDP-N-acetylglucosamine 2-epimerase (non-hydrolyzing), partial [Candidatus Bathyarchaeota archaeon]